MTETFCPESTTPAIPSDSELTLLRDDASGLMLVLTSTGDKNCAIHFPRRLAYQVTDEGDRLRSMEFLAGRAATPLGRIENSRWKAWFVEETLNIRGEDTLIHWCIVTPNDIVDVIRGKPRPCRCWPQGGDVVRTTRRAVMQSPVVVAADAPEADSHLAPFPLRLSLKPLDKGRGPPCLST